MEINMNLESFINFYREYASPNTHQDSFMLFFHSRYKFIGDWDAIPTGTICGFPHGSHMIDYVGNKHVSAFMIDYQYKERFVTFHNLEYLPDRIAQRYIVSQILKKVA